MVGIGGHQRALSSDYSVVMLLKDQVRSKTQSSLSKFFFTNYGAEVFGPMSRRRSMISMAHGPVDRLLFISTALRSFDR